MIIHTQLFAGIFAEANVVVVAPDVVEVVRFADNTSVGDPASRVAAYRIFHVTLGPVPDITSANSVMVIARFV